MANEVYMNVPAVKTMAKTLDTVHTVLDDIAKALEIISTTLKMTFFLGLVGAAAVALIDQVKPQIQQISQKCEGLSQAVNQSVDAYEKGDLDGSNLFMTSR